jgi:hypothetical protein
VCFALLEALLDLLCAGAGFSPLSALAAVSQPSADITSSAEL